MSLHRYCFTAVMLAFAYSLFQLFKGILEIADKGTLMSDKVSDFTSFIFDQVSSLSMIFRNLSLLNSKKEK